MLDNNSEQVGDAFPEVLAQQAAELCRRLASEREKQLVKAQAELLQERNRLKAENHSLESELQAARDPANSATSELSRGRLPSVETLVTTHDPGEEGLLAQWKPPQDKTLLQLETNLKITQAGAEDASGMSSNELTVKGWLESSKTERSFLSQAFKLGAISNEDVEAADSLFVLRKVYKDLDRRRVGLVCAQDLAAKTQRRLHKVSDLQDTIVAVNELLSKDGQKNRLVADSAGEFSELTFEGFQYLILHRHIEDLVSSAVASTIREIREYYVTWTTEAMILEKTRVAKDELSEELGKDRVPVWLEPLIGVLILLNALCIGLSQDVWIRQPVWTYVEGIFSVFFLVELLVKLHFVGCSEHFLGPTCVWNWFDLCVVIIALIGICLDYLMTDSNELNTLTIIRLIRVVRMARLVRLLRMKVFKELALMVNGVIGGLKTLCWAFVFLLGLVFILGVLMRQLASSGCEQGNNLPCHLVDHHEVLFSDVSRSMFTVFRCMIGDCTAPDGQSLAIQLTEHFGIVFAIGYVGVTCFVLFGVFNLIAAIFVENTLEAARVSQQKRQQAREKEHVRVAQELREIVLRICRRDRGARSTSSILQRPLICGGRRASRLGQALRRTFMLSEIPRRGAVEDDEEVDALEMSVSRPVFEEVMQDPVVLDIMEDLEINVADRSKLFDIIDSNGSGSLDVGEIIEGLMKLRGPADKGDIVCASLMVRSVQRDLHRLDAEMHERHRVMSKSQSDLQEALSRLIKGLRDHGMAVEELARTSRLSSAKPSKTLSLDNFTNSVIVNGTVTGTGTSCHKTQLI